MAMIKSGQAGSERVSFEKNLRESRELAIK